MLGVISGALEATRLRLSPSSDSRETREPSPWPAGGIIGRDIMSGFRRRHCVSLPAFTSVDGVVGSGACYPAGRRSSHRSQVILLVAGHPAGRRSSCWLGLSPDYCRASFARSGSRNSGVVEFS
ncbi:hypothetical protein U1Q18_015439 [Sarracenia purpurea var. burkii]